jgi:hypothetical protein
MRKEEARGTRDEAGDVLKPKRSEAGNAGFQPPGLPGITHFR